MLVQVLVSLTGERAIYLALELDRSWTEMIRSAQQIHSKDSQSHLFSVFFARIDSRELARLIGHSGRLLALTPVILRRHLRSVRFVIAPKKDQGQDTENDAESDGCGGTQPQNGEFQIWIFESLQI